MNVREWLRGLGLGQYEEMFRDNKIDLDVLADLTDGDLEKLGIPLGDRKRLLKAIAELAAREPLPARVPLAAAAPILPTQSFAHPDAAERRPITVMFCDLVGSTSLSPRLDAEDWRNMRQRLSRRGVEGGDRAWRPRAEEARRRADGAVRLPASRRRTTPSAPCAPRSQSSARLPNSTRGTPATGAPELVARIGLESGPVVVDAAGEVFGEAPNIAARVQAAAEPGTVLVTSTVQRQVAGLFIVEDKGAHELKGVPAPVTLYRIVRVSGGGRRKGARLLTPFVGREEDLGVLARRWERARAGDGQFVLIVGEPGIGKSRLVEEFRRAAWPRRRTHGSNGVRRSCCRIRRCILSWSGDGLGLAVPRLRRSGGSPSSNRSSRRSSSTPAEHAPLLAPLVDIPLPPERLPSIPPEEVRRQAAGGDGRLGAGRRASAAACSRLRGFAVVRPDLDRSRACARRARRAGAAAHSGDGAA